ncbi:IS3 family transposase [Pseudoteredinibacter isoporae]|nr:IS3 family transposase [Pseudoteredinibacter isoporae]NIB23616.1 IS3 family transposase [Pseudoteredinibacter isoporae]
MGCRRNCWNNAVAELFLSRLKKERIRKRIYKTRDLTKQVIFDDIEVLCNRKRRYSHLGSVSPGVFETAPKRVLDVS